MRSCHFVDAFGTIFGMNVSLNFIKIAKYFQIWQNYFLMVALMRVVSWYEFGKTVKFLKVDIV